MNKRARADGKTGPSTKERILSGARSAFYEAGFFASSVEDIAARAGVSRATVYLHFKGKDEMLVELLKEDLDYQLEIYRRLAAIKRVSLAAIKKWLGDFCEYIERQENSLGLFWAAGAAGGRREEIAHPHRDNVVALLGRRFRGFDLDALSRTSREARRIKCHMMIYLLEGVAMNAARGSSAPDRAAGIALLAPIFFDFLRGGDLRAVLD